MIDSREKKTDGTFVRKFVENKGFPAWDYASTLRQENRLVLLIPVIDPRAQTVTGIWNINLKGKSPLYHWMPRGQKPSKSQNLDNGALEVFMLGFEKRIFGAVQQQGVKVFYYAQRIEKKGERCTRHSGMGERSG